MAYFIVRVELHELNIRQKPSGEDYDRLHVAMQRGHYYRVIKGGNEQWYHMPHATYSATSDSMTKAAILENVKPIVKSVWTKAGILVTEGSSTWDGLIPASTQDVQQLTS